MAINLIARGFRSEGLRRVATGGRNRRVTTKLFRKNEKAQGALKWVNNWAGRFLSYLYKVSGLERLVNAFTATNFWEMISSGGLFLLDFNFNISEEEIQKQIDAAYTQIFAAAGGVIGMSLGYFVCGAIPSGALMVINKYAGMYAFSQLGEEYVRELSGALGTVAESTFRALKTHFMFFVFQNLRNYWKIATWQKRENDLLLALDLAGLDSKKISEIFEKQKEPWIISEKVENFIGGIKNNKIRAAANAIWDRFLDGCVDAGYVVAGSIDEFFITDEGLKQNKTVVDINIQSDDDVDVKIENKPQK